MSIDLEKIKRDLSKRLANNTAELVTWLTAWARDYDFDLPLLPTKVADVRSIVEANDAYRAYQEGGDEAAATQDPT